MKKSLFNIKTVTLKGIRRSWLGISVFFLAVNVQTGSYLFFPWVYRTVYTKYIPDPDNMIFRQILIITLSLLLVKVVFFFIRQGIEVRIKNSLSEYLRLELTARLLQFEYSFFRQKKTGEIVGNLIGEAETVTDVCFNIGKLSILILQITVFFVILIRIDLYAFFVFLAVIFLTAVLSVFFLKIITDDSLKIISLNEKFYTLLFYFQSHKRYQVLQSLLFSKPSDGQYLKRIG